MSHFFPKEDAPTDDDDDDDDTSLLPHPLHHSFQLLQQDEHDQKMSPSIHKPDQSTGTVGRLITNTLPSSQRHISHTSNS
jgi:hypothetical protein